MNDQLVEPILSWPVPTTVKEVQAFLGLAGFYRKFIEGYSKIVTLLSDLIKKGLTFQ